MSIVDTAANEKNETTNSSKVNRFFQGHPVTFTRLGSMNNSLYVDHSSACALYDDGCCKVETIEKSHAFALLSRQPCGFVQSAAFDALDDHDCCHRCPSIILF